MAISDVREKETMKTKTFLILRVVQVPTGVWQVASPKLDRTAQNPGFFVSGGQVFLSSFSRSFDESLSRRLVSGCQEPRTAQCSARVSRCLQPRGRWARSGKNISGCQLSAGVVGVASRAGAGSSGASHFAEREQFACEAVLSGFAGRPFEEQRAPDASSLLALVALLRVLVQSLLLLSTLPSENILLAIQFLLGVLAVMVRSSVLREDGGRSAPCQGAQAGAIFIGSACTFVFSPSFVSVSKFVSVARSGCHEFMRVHAWC